MADQEHIEVERSLYIAPGSQWAPSVGNELHRLLEGSSLDDDAKRHIREQSVAVLGQGVPPEGEGESRRTGLVVGYVQSGKTMSFTSVIALAHDNGIPLVVLLAGTKRNLHRQTLERLERDLEVRRVDRSQWLMIADPHATAATVQETEAVLKEAMSAGSSNPLLKPFSRGRRTIVMTVMKNSSGLDHLRETLVAVAGRGINFASVPVLIVDDEADQAGLNTRSGDDEDPSATYRAIRDLRDSIPRHTYLEYTATPQAPLLLNLLDTLAPDYVAVLVPGRGYTGGEYFFRDHRDQFLENLPQKHADEGAGDDPPAPPRSLEHALMTYLVASLLMGTRDILQSSMLVHPSQTRDLHDRYNHWVRSMLATWKAVIDAGGTDLQDLIEDLVQPALARLANEEDRPAIDDVVGALPHVMAQVQVRVVNSGAEKDSEIEWERFPFWVLVGGNKLDRGYTVEGLVTTYMPRGVGGGQADTLQQRARFFGYKAKYADLCRAWLTPSTSDLYEKYVEHEQVLRKELERVAQDGEDLKRWRRKMLIDSALKPCRASVIGLPFIRERVKGGHWHRFERLMIASERIESNRRLLDEFLDANGGLRFPDPRDGRGDKVNQVISISLREMLEDFLVSWHHDPLDRSVVNAAALLFGARLDERPHLGAELYLMRDLLPRERAVSASDPGKINNLFEGHRPGGGGDSYPGDQVFRSESSDVVSVQIHIVTVKGFSGYSEVPALALFVPKPLAADILLGEE